MASRDTPSFRLGPQWFDEVQREMESHNTVSVVYDNSNAAHLSLKCGIIVMLCLYFEAFPGSGRGVIGSARFLVALSVSGRENEQKTR